MPVHRALSSIVVAAAAIAMLCASPGVSAGELEDANKKIVLAFHEEVLNGRNADAASKYVAESYVQHNPRVPDGLAGLKAFVEGMRRNAPEARSSVKRVVAEGDLVVLHSHVQRGAQDRGAALVDIFRVKDGKLVEHWDVVQPVPEAATHSNGMF